MSQEIQPTHFTDLALLRRGLPEAAVEDAIQLLDVQERSKLALLLGEQLSIFDAAPISGNALAPIETDEQEAAIVALVGRAFKVEQEADRLRKERTAPLNAEVKAVNGLITGAFAHLLSLFGKASEAERVLGAYRRLKAARKQREKEEADRRALEAAEREAAARAKEQAAQTERLRADAAAEAEAASRDQMMAELAQPRALPKTVKTEDGKVGFAQVWDVEIVDASLLPREYLMADEKKIRAAVKAGAREIPGCNVFERDAMRRGV